MEKKPTILIADDSSFMRKILMGILEESGYSKFIECGTGSECIEKCKSEHPDLVLLDIIMPGMDGLEALKKIGNAVPVLMVSAIGQEKYIEDAKKLGAKGYIIKPFQPNIVLGEIRKVLK